MRNAAFAQIGIQGQPARDAKPRLERTGRVVDSRVDDFAVARAGAGAGRRFRFQRDDLAARERERPCHRKAHDAGPDDDGVDLLMCREPTDCAPGRQR